MWCHAAERALEVIFVVEAWGCEPAIWKGSAGCSGEWIVEWVWARRLWEGIVPERVWRWVSMVIYF